MILRGKWKHRLVNSVQRRSSTTRSRTAAEDQRRGKKRYDELPSTVTWSQQCWLSTGAIKDEKTRIYDIIRILKRSLSEIWTQKDISLYLVWLNVSVFSHRWQYRLAQLYGHHFFPVGLVCLGIKDCNWSRWSVGRSCEHSFAATILRQQSKFDCQEKEAFL